MKHQLKITAIILGMFILTQLIGIYVVNSYSHVKIVNGDPVEVNAPPLPFGIDVPAPQQQSEFTQAFASIIFAFMIAIFLLLMLTKFNAEMIIKLWFFVVVAIAIGISFNVFFVNTSIFLPGTLALSLGFILSFLKIYKRGFIVHNFTELFIYPGIAAVFVPILNIYTIVILLIIISIYDMWAVWHSGIMQKMAKYQMDKLKVFSGFFVPYIPKNVKLKLQKMKKSDLKKKRIKVNVAVLGGGDVVFPIITAGVMIKTFGLFSAFLVVVGAALGLSYLLFFSEKKKFYPAMPFITAGIFLGILISYLIA